jgi:ankyrin repeat protein
VEIAKTLIQSGAHVNAQKNDGSTPLMMAVTAKQDKLFQIFLDVQADLSLRNNNGDTALQLAQSMKYFPAISALSAAGRASKSFSEVKTITVQIPHLGVTRKLPFNPNDSISEFIETHFKSNPRNPIDNLEDFGLFHHDKFMMCGTHSHYKVQENVSAFPFLPSHPKKLSISSHLS